MEELSRMKVLVNYPLQKGHSYAQFLPILAPFSKRNFAVSIWSDRHASHKSVVLLYTLKYLNGRINPFDIFIVRQRKYSRPYCLM